MKFFAWFINASLMLRMAVVSIIQSDASSGYFAIIMALLRFVAPIYIVTATN